MDEAIDNQNRHSLPGVVTALSSMARGPRGKSLSGEDDGIKCAIGTGLEMLVLYRVPHKNELIDDIHIYHRASLAFIIFQVS